MQSAVRRPPGLRLVEFAHRSCVHPPLLYTETKAGSLRCQSVPSRGSPVAFSDALLRRCSFMLRGGVCSEKRPRRPGASRAVARSVDNLPMGDSVAWSLLRGLPAGSKCAPTWYRLPSLLPRLSPIALCAACASLKRGPLLPDGGSTASSADDGVDGAREDWLSSPRTRARSIRSACPKKLQTRVKSSLSTLHRSLPSWTKSSASPEILSLRAASTLPRFCMRNTAYASVQMMAEKTMPSKPIMTDRIAPFCSLLREGSFTMYL
mmetsp:Transcript_69322/g.203481  ORF Transcript_69322/g.203481 Transcript_69322/m.203481 type:complete len:264 (+) Transcript_69322:771-1562(+)